MKLIEKLQSIGAYIDYPVINVEYPQSLPRNKPWPDLARYMYRVRGEIEGNEDAIFEELIRQVNLIIFESSLGFNDPLLSLQNGINHRHNFQHEDIIILWKPPKRIMTEYDIESGQNNTNIYYQLQVVQK